MNSFSKYLICLLIFIEFFPFNFLISQINEKIVGNIRVQALSDNLIRIEQKGPNGFEDRNTFTVVNRNWPGTAIKTKNENNLTVLTTLKCRIEIPNNSESINGIRIRSNDEKTVYQFKDVPPVSYLPGPGGSNHFWLLADCPRLVPPEWGATPPPEKFKSNPLSGWDTTNNAEDVYIFILEKGKYDTFKKDFLKLTGPTPLPPLFAFGLWNSRYYEYSEKSALETINTYRKKQIPLDVFVIDTDWRLGASHGYAVNDSLFPDMKRFIENAHKSNVYLMFNDHPEAQKPSALSPDEFQYRWDGLTSLLKEGNDVWWYDRNWSTGLLEPMSGIKKEVWGMRLYHDLTKKFNPERRPLIMSNVDGIDNGFWNAPSHPASHRFPIWWTGDQKSRWEYLEMGIANGVNSGIYRMMPYVNEDLGGHTAGNPEPDQYVRWIQYGVFSPVTRLHCTRGLTRYPWDYGEEAERITSEYIRLRYRLLPTIYSAAHRAYEDGTPVMRRCDLEWPDESQSGRDKQYLFGEDLLIAPYALSKTKDIPLRSVFFQTQDGKPGLTGEYFDNQELKGKPVLIRVDTVLNFIWGTESPDPIIPVDHFSVRWSGKIQVPFNENALKLKVISDDGVRVWIDDTLIIDAWHDQAATDYPITKYLLPGKFYSIKIEYFENMGSAHFQAIQTINVEQTFNVWIPPGKWRYIWTGEESEGPKILTFDPPLWQCPIYIRDGGIIFSVPQMQFTGELAWNKIIVDAFVSTINNTRTIRTIYEDDGISPDYQKGIFCKTRTILSRNNNKVQLTIDKINGRYKGAIERREWVIRFNLPQKTRTEDIRIDGKIPGANSPYKIKLIPEKEQKEDAMPFLGPGSKPRVSAGSILEINIFNHKVQEPIRISFDLLSD